MRHDARFYIGLKEFNKVAGFEFMICDHENGDARSFRSRGFIDMKKRSAEQVCPSVGADHYG